MHSNKKAKLDTHMRRHTGNVRCVISIYLMWYLFTNIFLCSSVEIKTEPLEVEKEKEPLVLGSSL